MTASRESYGAAEDRLNALAPTVDADALAAAGDDILGVADLLVRQPRLRRALSDPARTGEDRAGLLRSVLADNVGEHALDLLGTLVAGRWSSSAEMLDATERLGAEAVLAGAERAGALGEVEDELFRFGQVVNGSPELAATLGDPAMPVERRIELVHTLLDGKAHAATIRLAGLAVRGFGGRGFGSGLTRLVEVTADRRDRQVAYVTVAEPLSDADERRLGAKLTELYGREVSVRQTVDPQVLGGVRVQVGADLYDGTILRRLTETRNALARG